MSDDEAPRGSSSGWEAWVFTVLFLIFATVAGYETLNFIAKGRAPARASCIANLKQIDGAVQQWALENKKTATDTYSLSDSTLLAYMKGSALPVCPDRGRYLPGTSVADSPRCSIGGPGHTI